MDKLKNYIIYLIECNMADLRNQILKNFNYKEKKYKELYFLSYGELLKIYEKLENIYYINNEKADLYLTSLKGVIHNNSFFQGQKKIYKNINEKMNLKINIDEIKDTALINSIK